MSQTGTHDLQDLLNWDNTTAEQFGYDRLNDVINRELTATNTVVNEQLALFAEDTTDREAGAPAGGSPRMVKVDPDYARSRTQKGQSAAKRGFPLHALEYAAGFTSMYLRMASPADMARVVLSARTAYVGALRDGIMSAFFTPTNYTFIDYVTPDKMPVDVKALANGDGEVPPITTTGRKFVGTHNHFNFSSGLTLTAAEDLTRDVTEHYEGNRVIIYINSGNEAAWRGLAGFAPYLPGNVVPPNTQLVAAGNLDITQTDDRPIGVLPNGAVVHTKPWIPLDYAVAINTNAPRPLKRRLHRLAAFRGLFLHGTNAALPLQADAFQAYFGFGASERYAAAVLYYAAGAASYVTPEFNEWADEEGSDL